MNKSKCYKSELFDCKNNKNESSNIIYIDKKRCKKRIKGATGATGVTGFTGATGAAGATGPTGLQITSIVQPFAELTSNISQFVDSVIIEKVVNFDAQELLSQIIHSLIINPSRIIIQIPGVYKITCTMQLTGASANINVWMRKNGLNMVKTCSETTLQNANDFRVHSISILDSALVGDYYEIVQASTDVNAGLVATNARVDPLRPSNPSIILTISKISDLSI